MIKIGQTYVGLQDPEGKIDAIVERWHSLDLMKTVSDPPASKVYRGKNLLFPNYPPLPCPRINQIVVPTGATRWSYGLFLATTAMKDAILAEAEAESKLENRVLVEFSTTANGQSETNKPFKMWMHPLQPRPVSPRPVTENEQASAVHDLWLMPFVDRRYWWQFKTVGQMSRESFSDVQSIVDYLEDILDCRIQLTCLNSKYNKTPDILADNDEENAAVVLETLAWHTGCQLVPEMNSTPPSSRTSVDGAGFSLVGVEDSPLIYANNLAGKLGVLKCVRNASSGNVTIPDNGWELVGKPSAIMGGEYQDSGKQLPASILLKGKSAYQQKTATSVGITAKTVAGTSAPLRMNYTGLTTIPDEMAQQITKDYYRRFAKLYDWTFAGVQPWQPTVFDDCVIMFQSRYSGDHAKSDYGAFQLQTRVRGWVANLLPESPQTGSSGNDETPQVSSGEFVCGNCLSCLDPDDTDNVHSDCALADPSPNSFFIYDDASNCCDNIADSNVEIIHDSACLWESEERECKEKFIEESLNYSGAAEVDEEIFHKWILEVEADWVVLTHRWYRKT